MPDVKHFDPQATLETVLRLFWRRGAAATGVQDVVRETGLSRSSLYGTFGGKQELYLAALRRYLEEYSEPVFGRLAADGRGLPAVRDFFDGLIGARCSGAHARWGCMVANAHAGQEAADPAVRGLLDRHHRVLRDALRAALAAAARDGQLAPGCPPEQTADMLTLLAYGVNLRSRAGADAAELTATVTAALERIAAGPAG